MEDSQDTVETHDSEGDSLDDSERSQEVGTGEQRADPSPRKLVKVFVAKATPSELQGVLRTLPLELQLTCLKYLSLENVCLFQGCSRWFYTNVNESMSLWKFYFQRRWGKGAQPERVYDWKLHYQIAHRLEWQQKKAEEKAKREIALAEQIQKTTLVAAAFINDLENEDLEIDEMSDDESDDDVWLKGLEV